MELGGNSGTGKKSVEAVAKEVLTGKWGNGENRKKKLEVLRIWNDLNTNEQEIVMFFLCTVEH